MARDHPADRRGRWRATARPFKGVLYAGLMLTADGPKLIEYNVRFGDPECQVLMMRLKSDLLPALIAARDGVLDRMSICAGATRRALCVVMAAEGYPDDPRRGTRDPRPRRRGGGDPDVTDLPRRHAARRRPHPRRWRPRARRHGARRATSPAARARAYAAVDRIDWPEGFCRRDIGVRGTR